MNHSFLKSQKKEFVNKIAIQEKEVENPMGRKVKEEKEPVKITKPQKKCKMTLNQIANKATAEGLTYGEYVSKYGL